jgi:hypothetical protein
VGRVENRESRPGHKIGSSMDAEDTWQSLKENWRESGFQVVEIRKGEEVLGTVEGVFIDWPEEKIVISITPL